MLFNHLIRTSIVALCFSVFVSFVSGCCGAPCSIGSLPDEYQSVLNNAVTVAGVPGGVMGVFCRDFWAAGASGLANLDAETPMQADSQMRIASMTKTFTAALVLKLADEGRLSLDDPLERWLPGVFADGARITVGMLLNHTAGIHDHQGTPELVNTMLSDSERVWSQQDVLDLLTAYPLDFEPGSAYSYSNGGYYLLGIVIEKASGQTVQDALEQRIFDRYDIQRTQIIDGTISAPAADFYSILRDSDALSNVTHWNLSWNWTAGAGVTTAGDMLHFLHGLFETRLLSKAMRAQMATVQTPANQYGYGMNVKTYKGKTVLSHGGANPGNVGTWAYIPEIEAGFFVGFNRLDLTDPAFVANEMQNIIDQTSDLLIAQSENASRLCSKLQLLCKTLLKHAESF